MNPPRAKVIPETISFHGDKRVDDYYWLRDRSNGDVLDYLRAENEYCSAALGHTEALQRTLYEEMRLRLRETDSSVPERIDDFEYFVRTERGLQYEIHMRRHPGDAEEEIVLDENELASDHDYFAVGAFSVSPDHRFLAYSVDTDGSEQFTLHVKDLDSGEQVGEPIPNTYYGVEWANDSRSFYYVTLDAALRPYRLHRHRLGLPADADEELYIERDEAFFLSISKTRTRRYVLMNLGSKTTTEVHALDAEDPEALPRVIHPREHEMEYYVAHHGDSFYVLTNEFAKNFKLMVTPVSDTSKSNWAEVLPHRKSVKIDDVDLFRNFLVVYERESGLKRIRVTDMRSDETHYVRFPDPVYTFWPAENPEFECDILRFNYTSLITPRTVYEYDMHTREQNLLKCYDVPGDYDPSQYRMERVFAAANDGTRIPISIVHRKDLKKNGGNPLFLYGYGAYGASIEPYFVANRLSLLDRGFVYAIAHVRGGGEMGRHWYEQGKLLNKRNTFTDFIACAEHLIEKGFTSSGEIVAYGGSAGGLLVGAVANMRPDIWRSIVAHVPFVDVLNTMLDDRIPLTVIEYEEWGNPADKKFYEYIRAYSPYDNVKKQYYPPMLVTAGLNDPRVQYWEPAKWTARLRATKVDDNLLVLRTRMGEGHSGPSGRYDYLRDVALDYAFVLDQFGITE